MVDFTFVIHRNWKQTRRANSYFLFLVLDGSFVHVVSEDDGMLCEGAECMLEGVGVCVCVCCVCCVVSVCVGCSVVSCYACV